MWNLAPQLSSKIKSILPLPLLNYDEAMIVILGLMIIKIGMDKFLAKKFNLTIIKKDKQFSNLQYSPFYHLSIVILVLQDIDWNMFDLAIWMYTYVGIGIIRKGLLSIKNQKQTLLNNYSFDIKTLHILQSSKYTGICLLLISIWLLIIIELTFSQINFKILNLLIFPIILLIIDSLFLFLSSVASEKDILCYYNQNINQIQPTYKLQLTQKIIGNSIKAWHFYNLIRIFIKTLLDKMGVLDYLWIFSILNAGFSSIKILVSSISKYRSYNRLMKKFDRLFRRSTSAPDQVCTICLTELLNCRQLASCGHLFHYRCLFQWMQTKLQCPVCRIPIKLN